MEDKTLQNIGKYLQGLSDSIQSETNSLKQEIGEAVVNNLSEERIRDSKERYFKMIGELCLIDRLLRGFPELKQ